MFNKYKDLIACGEGVTIEFKECAKELPKSVFETICSFLNRFGGDILLGGKRRRDNRWS